MQVRGDDRKFGVRGGGGQDFPYKIFTKLSTKGATTLGRSKGMVPQENFEF